MILMLLSSRRRTPTELVSAIPRDSYSAKNAGLASRCCTIAPRNVVHRFLYPPVDVLLRNRYTGWVYTNARYGSYELVVYTLGSSWISCLIKKATGHLRPWRIYLYRFCSSGIWCSQPILEILGPTASSCLQRFLSSLPVHWGFCFGRSLVSRVIRSEDEVCT